MMAAGSPGAVVLPVVMEKAGEGRPCSQADSHQLGIGAVVANDRRLRRTGEQVKAHAPEKLRSASATEALRAGNHVDSA